MATVLNTTEQQNEKNRSISSSAPVYQTGVNGSSIQQSSPKGTSSGRFTNIQSYLKANQGPGMAGQITQNVQKQGEDVSKQVQQQGQQLQGVTQDFSNRAQNAAQQYSQQIAQDPTRISTDPNELRKFEQSARDVQYAGPQQLGNIYKLQSQTQGLADTGKLVGNEAGRKQLLTQTYRQPTYTKGQVGLDQALLQTNPEQLRQLKAVQSVAQQAQKNLSQEQVKALENIKNAQQVAQQSRDKVKGALENQAISTQQDLNKRASDIKTQRELEYQRAAERLGNLNLSDADLQALGLTRGQQIYNLTGNDLTKYLLEGEKINLQDPTSVARIANTSDIAKINALKTLAGDTASQQASKIYNQVYGGLEQNPYNMAANAKQGIQNILNEAKQGYEKESYALDAPMRQATEEINRLTQLINGGRIDQGAVQEDPERYVNNATGESTTDQNVIWDFKNAPNALATQQQRMAGLQAALKQIQQKYGIGRTLSNYQSPVPEETLPIQSSEGII